MCALLSVTVAAYVGLHRALPAAGGPAYFWVDTLPGRLAECGFWGGMGVLLSALSALARRRARRSPAGNQLQGNAKRHLLGLLAVVLLLGVLAAGTWVLPRLAPESG